METPNFFRLIFLSLCIGLVLLFTWSHLLSVSDLLDCTTNSARCTSNRFQSKQPTHLKNRHNSHTLHRNHASNTPHHPLDPLTVQELNKIRTFLSSHLIFSTSAGYALHSVELEETDKSLVLKWKKDGPLLPRKASVVANMKGESHLLTVHLATSEVVVHRTGSHSGYPMMTLEDMTTATWELLVDTTFNRMIIERGVDLTDLACLPISTRWYGKKEENRRLIKVKRVFCLLQSHPQWSDVSPVSVELDGNLNNYCVE